MLNLKRTLLSSAMTLALSQGVMTQAATATGVIEDRYGILPGAIIEVVDQAITATADSKGQFTLKGVSKGDYQLKITYMGYQDTIIPITIENEKSVLGALLLNNSENLEEVEIVGSMVRGEMRALNMKKNASNIKDVISQDGIGKLPDRNAAEAVQRVPGVSIERDQGEGRFVAVRGLPSQWNSATINGNRIPTAEEETTTRATAFDFFPTDLIEMVEVNKALTANLEGDAIGGSVNFITKTAPSERTLKLGVGTNYNAKAEGYGYNWSALWGDRLMDGKLGYLVNVTGWSRDWATDNFEPRRKSDGGIKRLELRDYTGTRETYGINTGLEYNFDNGDQIYARGLYGTLSDEETHYKHRFRFDKDRVELQHIYNELITEMFGIDVGGEHNLGANTQLKWNLAHYDNQFYYGDSPNSKDKSYFVARFDQKNVGYEGLGSTKEGSKDNLSYSKIDGGPNAPDATSTHLPSGFQYDPASMGIANVNLYKVDITERDRAIFSLDIAHEFSQDLTLTTGVKYRDKERLAKFSDEFYIWDESKGGPTPTLADFNLSGQPGRDEFLNELDINYSDSLSQVGDVKDMQNFWNANRDNFVLSDDDSYTVANGRALGRNFDLYEKQSAIYGMADYVVNTQTSINAGLRIEHTDVTIDGYTVDEATKKTVSLTKKANYLAILPSLHIKHEAHENQNIRLSLTRSYARPDFGDISPGVSFLEHDDELHVGNPKLKETFSNNVDVTWENYFDSVGILSAGLFYKYIENPVYKEITDEEFAGKSVSRIEAKNANKAWLVGAEMTFDRRFDFILPVLSDVGMRMNYTFMNSEMKLPKREDKVALSRQADQLANFMLYYDNSTFAARIAMNYKGPYIEEHGEGVGSDAYYGSYTSVDFSAQYSVTDDLLVYFEANNLNNEPLTYYTGNPDRPKQVEYYGPRFQLGISYDVF